MLFYDIIGRVRTETQECQHHLDIALYAPELGLELPRLGGIDILQRKAHGCYRRFYLMHPHGVVIHRLTQVLLILLLGCLVLLTHKADYLLIVTLNDASGFGEGVGKLCIKALYPLKLGVLFLRPCDIRRSKGQQQRQAQRRRVYDRLEREAVEHECHRIKRSAQNERQKCRYMLFYI